MKDLSFISEHRASFMGFAILWIMLMHFKAFDGVPIIGDFIALGELGVDIFLFLSSFGLCYSLNKNNDLNFYYKNRLVRILPVWVFLLALMHVKNYMLGLPCPHNLVQGLCFYTGIGWWIRAFIPTDPHNYWYEWYIPTLLVFYIFFPYFYKKTSRSIVIWIVAAIVLGTVLRLLPVFLFHFFHIQNGFLSLCECLHWTYQRFPVFLAGIQYYRLYTQPDLNKKLSNNQHVRSLILGGVNR